MAVDPNVGADVEIYEPVQAGEPPVVAPRRVRVNGVDVGLIDRDSLKVDYGGGVRAMTVTLTLFPRTVWMGAEVQPEPKPEPEVDDEWDDWSDEAGAD